MLENHKKAGQVLIYNQKKWFQDFTVLILLACEWLEGRCHAWLICVVSKPGIGQLGNLPTGAGLWECNRATLGSIVHC